MIKIIYILIGVLIIFFGVMLTKNYHYTLGVVVTLFGLGAFDIGLIILVSNITNKQHD
jgi:uncharacterized membrane protein HdeD (DUF308 family)